MMNKRKVTAIMISATLASVTLAGNVMAQNEYPTIDFNNTTVYGDVGPDGSVPGGLEDVQLTDEEIQKVKDGNFKVAICYHQLDNQVNQSKLSACQEVLEELGIEVVAVTDAQSDAVKEVDQLETALALNPDALLSMPYDVEVTKQHIKNILMQKYQLYSWKTHLLILQQEKIMWQLQTRIHMEMVCLLQCCWLNLSDMKERWLWYIMMLLSSLQMKETADSVKQSRNIILILKL